MMTTVNGNPNPGSLDTALWPEKNPIVPALLALGLVSALTLYCHVSAIVEHSAVSWFESIAWAIRVSAGWIVVTGLLWRFGPALFSWGTARRHPRALLTVLFVSCCGITLAFDFVTSGDMPLTDFLFRRVPAALLGNALMLGAVGLIEVRRRMPGAAPENNNHPSTEVVAPAMIEVMTGTGRTDLRLDEIECFEADGNYINVIHKSGRRYLLRQTLVELQKRLDSRFVRVHRSAIVNLNAIVERRTGAILVLGCGHTVRVSRRSLLLKPQSQLH